MKRNKQNVRLTHANRGYLVRGQQNLSQRVGDAFRPRSLQCGTQTQHSLGDPCSAIVQLDYLNTYASLWI